MTFVFCHRVSFFCPEFHSTEYQKVNDEVVDFQKDVIERSKQIPIVVDFWAEWCGPCRILGPILEKLAGVSDGRWALAKVDTEQHQQVAMEYGIRSIPNVKLFVDGKPVDEFTGALPEYAVVQWLDKALPNQFKKDLEKAQALLATGKSGEAQKLLAGILEGEKENHQAQTLLAQVIFPGNPAKALELVQGIEEDSEQFPMAEAIVNAATLFQKLDAPEKLPHDPVKQQYLGAITSMKAGQYDDALRDLIEVIRTNRYYDDDGARLACIAIFRLLGEDHEVTQKHRRNFGSALNV
jgi:putative thioredoxin